MTGGSDVFFWVENLHPRYFFGSRENTRIFFGSYLRANFSFRVFVAISGSEKYSFELFFQRSVFRVLVFFWVGNFDARYFFGSKISGLCIFLGLQYEAPSDPPPPRHVCFEYPGVSPTAILPPGEGPGGQVYPGFVPGFTDRTSR